MATQPHPGRGRRSNPGRDLAPSESGAALLVTVLILLVVSILGTTVVSMGSVDYTLSSNYRSSISALNIAEILER